jgi:hypothetical protein
MPRPTANSAERRKSPGAGVCQDCTWVSECTRERARQHAAKHGHTVHFVISDTTVYKPWEPPNAD